MIRNIAQALWRWRVRIGQPGEIRRLRELCEANRKAHKPTRHLEKQMREIRNSRLGKA